MRTISLLLLVLISGFSRAQEPQIDVQQVSALTADSASIEPMAERVAIFATGLDKQAQYGLRITVKSQAKFVVLRAANAQHRQVPPHKMSGEASTWIVFGPPGLYYLTIVESDPETGLAFWDLERSIVSDQPNTPDDPPEDPTDPPSDPGLFGPVKLAASQAADKVNDPPTRAKLALAYRSVIATAGGDYDTLLVSARKARFNVLNARTGESRKANWNEWLLIVDEAIQAVVPPGNTMAYINALDAIASGLEQGS